MFHTLTLLVAVATMQSPPVITLPAPTGIHPVGVLTARWLDSTRIDSLSTPGGPRQVSVQVWYPAAPRSRGVLAAYAQGVDTSAGEYGHLMARVQGHAVAAAPFAASMGRAPVILLSTGRSMAAYDYTTLAEDLASHGFVVVGVNSPQLSRFILPDGGTIPPWPAPPLRVLQHFDSADVFFEPMIRLVAADLRFVVRRLIQLDRDDRILAGRLDLDRLGMMGHSNGALAGSQACAEERRCRVFLGIEGTQARSIRKEGIAKPYAILISAQSLSFDAESVYQELGTRQPRRYTVITVDGAGHNTFTDLLLIRPTLFNYPIAPERGVLITRAAARAFFERLRGADGDAALAAAMAPYAEVTLRTSFASRPPTH